MFGLLASSSQKTALTGHASKHSLHPIHLELLRITPPPFLSLKASVGQTFMHGGSGQALQAMTTNPLSNPPMDLTLIADLDNPPFPYLLLHANMQS